MCVCIYGCLCMKHLNHSLAHCSLLTMYILLSSLLLFGAIFLYFSRILTFHGKKSLLPPGKFGWPVIGESLEFGSTLLNGHPEKFIHTRLKKYSPSQVFKTSILGEKISVLFGASGNKLLFSNDNKLVVSWWPSAVDKIVLSGRPSLIVSKRTRSYLLEFLKPEALYKYVSIAHNMVQDHVRKEWIVKSEVIVSPLMKKLAFSISCRFFVGLEDSKQITTLMNFFDDSTPGLFAIPIDFPGTVYNRAKKAAKRLKNELVKVIKQRRSQLLIKGGSETNQERRSIFTKLLLETDEKGEFLPEMDIADQMFGILIASHDSTYSTITSVIYYLADHPLIYARVLEEQMEILKSKGTEMVLSMDDIQKMKYSRNVVNEVLRIATPVPGIFKEVITEFSFQGRLIPKGWKIFMSTQATHKSEEYFADPHKFDPSRFEGKGPIPFTFVPFGGGPKMCPGSEFARIEILVIIHCLVTKFGWEKLIPNEQLRFNPTPVPENGLPIRLLPHGNY